MISCKGHPSRYDSFIAVIRPSMVFSMMLALVPISIEKSSHGKYYTKLSSAAVVYTFVICFPGYTCVIYMMLKYELLVVPHMYLAYKMIRIFICLGIHITCLRKRRELLAVLNQVSELQVALPVIWASLPLVITAVCLFAFATNFIITKPTLMSFLLAMNNGAPTSVFVCVHALFGFQVAAVCKALVQLNHETRKHTEILRSRGIPSLRSIMKRHQRLSDICSLLNESYGLIMFLATSGILFEVIFCVVAVLTYPHMSILQRTSMITWSVTVGLFAVFSMLICQAVEDEVQETKALSANMRTVTFNRLLDLDIETLQWKLQLQQLQLCFHANGFFDLNGVQVNAVFSTILTYVVILMQNWLP